MNKLLFIGIVGLLLAGCKLDNPCPPDIFLGNVTMKDSSLTAIPYTGQETLVFVRENGDSLILTSARGIIDTVYDAVVETPCTSLPDPQTNYYTIQQQYIIWQDSKANNYFFLLNATEVIYADSRSDTILADRLVAGFYKSGFPTYVGPAFILSNRTGEELPAFYKNAKINNPIAIADTTFLGYNFTDIFENNRELPSTEAVYFSRTEGLVAFQDAVGFLWVLKSKR